MEDIDMMLAIIFFLNSYICYINNYTILNIITIHFLSILLSIFYAISFLEKCFPFKQAYINDCIYNTKQSLLLIYFLSFLIIV